MMCLAGEERLVKACVIHLNRFSSSKEQLMKDQVTATHTHTHTHV